MPATPILLRGEALLAKDIPRATATSRLGALSQRRDRRLSWSTPPTARPARLGTALPPSSPPQTRHRGALPSIQPLPRDIDNPPGSSPPPPPTHPPGRINQHDLAAAVTRCSPSSANAAQTAPADAAPSPPKSGSASSPSHLALHPGPDHLPPLEARQQSEWRFER